MPRGEYEPLTGWSASQGYESFLSPIEYQYEGSGDDSENTFAKNTRDGGTLDATEWIRI
jgi:hypothetical protein